MRHTSCASDRSKSGPPSLNRDLRKMELNRITQENQAILKRIQKAQPIYNHVEWEDSYRKNEAYLKNVCEYPPTPSTRGSMRSTGGLAMRPMSKPGLGEGEDFRASSARSAGRGGLGPTSSSPQNN